MLKVYTIFYNILLISFIVLNFVASLIVGAAGHSSGDNHLDYIYLIIATIISLFIYCRKTVTSSILKYINIILVSVWALVVVYSAIEAIIEIDYVYEILIPLGIALLFIILSIALIKALIIYKPSSLNN